MRKFMIFMILSIGFLVYATAAPPPVKDTGTTMEVVKQDGTVSVAKTFIQEWEVPGKHTNLVISVDELSSEAYSLFASVSSAPQEEPEPPPIIEEGQTTLDYILKNWQWLLAALIPLLEIIVRLTPTEKDNTILSRILGLLGRIFPNNMKGGGTHATPG